ncbi:hypothetical protein [Psychrobacter pygoscelis]|uniref:hypothetical protein n=1 Tax=Psychrobacter pygoscelis TaxID=2488563 RepID=UPI00103A15B6|nr:hypothetical protein [Psychrobacter pygoscelis]
MNTITYNEALKEIRSYARNLGMTFTKQNATINGKQAWMLIDRQSGRVLENNFTLWCAYEDRLNGYFDKVANDNSCINPMVVRILKAISEVADEYEGCPERTEGFARSVCIHLDKKYNINVLNSSYAQDKFHEAMDKYFA